MQSKVVLEKLSSGQYDFYLINLSISTTTLETLSKILRHLIPHRDKLFAHKVKNFVLSNYQELPLNLECIELFASIISENYELEHISIQSGIYGSDIIPIANALGLNTNLKSFSLTGCEIDSNTFNLFKSSLIANTTLTNFDISHNCLDNRCIGDLEYVLRHSNLVNINIAYNNIDDFGICELAKVLVDCETLEYFCIQDNPFGIVGENAIVEMLNLNRNLRVYGRKSFLRSRIENKLLGSSRL